jgi:methionine biosynthesis protein MetW
MLLRLNIYEKWARSRNVTFISLLEFNPKAKVVDLGCGNGEFTLRAKEKIGCNEIIGVDADEERLNEAEKKGIIVVNHDLNDTLPFRDNSFDVIICNQVIEHLYYPVKFMREVYRILKPKGYAVISTENLASWDNIFVLLLGYTPFSMEFDSGLYKIGNPLSPHEKEVIKEPFPHVRVFAWKGLIELAKFVGFKVEKAVGSGHVLGRLGEIVNKRKARFITIKVRK